MEAILFLNHVWEIRFQIYIITTLDFMNFINPTVLHFEFYPARKEKKYNLLYQELDPICEYIFEKYFFSCRLDIIKFPPISGIWIQ